MITPDWLMAGSQLVGSLTGGGGAAPGMATSGGSFSADGWTVATGRASARGGSVSKPADALAAANAAPAEPGMPALDDTQKLVLAGLAGLALWSAAA